MSTSLKFSFGPCRVNASQTRGYLYVKMYLLGGEELSHHEPMYCGRPAFLNAWMQTCLSVAIADVRSDRRLGVQCLQWGGFGFRGSGSIMRSLDPTM